MEKKQNSTYEVPCSNQAESTAVSRVAFNAEAGTWDPNIYRCIATRAVTSLVCCFWYYSNGVHTSIIATLPTAEPAWATGNKIYTSIYIWKTRKTSRKKKHTTEWEAHKTELTLHNKWNALQEKHLNEQEDSRNTAFSCFLESGVVSVPVLSPRTRPWRCAEIFQFALRKAYRSPTHWIASCLVCRIYSWFRFLCSVSSRALWPRNRSAASSPPRVSLSRLHCSMPKLVVDFEHRGWVFRGRLGGWKHFKVVSNLCAFVSSLCSLT